MSDRLKSAFQSGREAGQLHGGPRAFGWRAKRVVDEDEYGVVTKRRMEPVPAEAARIVEGVQAVIDGVSLAELRATVAGGRGREAARHRGVVRDPGPPGAHQPAPCGQDLPGRRGRRRCDRMGPDRRPVAVGGVPASPRRERRQHRSTEAAHAPDGAGAVRQVRGDHGSRGEPRQARVPLCAPDWGPPWLLQEQHPRRARRVDGPGRDDAALRCGPPGATAQRGSG